MFVYGMKGMDGIHFLRYGLMFNLLSGEIKNTKYTHTYINIFTEDSVFDICRKIMG